MSVTAARLMVVIGGDASGAQAALGDAAARLDAFSQRAEEIGNNLTRWVTLPLLGVGAAAGKLAADFDRNMNVLQVTSKATAEEMEALREEARALGEDLSLPGTSAADAGEAMLNLTKAGMSVNDVLGASRGVLQMSAAGHLSNAEAAKIAAGALNAFGLEGSEATRIADLLAAAANSSSAELGELADGLRMSSAVFASAKIPVEDLVTALGMMANAGIRSRDAGTSLKQMMLSLQAPSSKAAALMQELGINVYDAGGNMLSMEEIIGQFSDALGGLTQEQRNATLATIFGSDAIRAANVVLMGGVDAFQTLKTAVTEQGAAADLAAAQTKGLGGALDRIRSAAETALMAGIEPLEDDILSLAGVIELALTNFSELDDGTRDLIAKLGLMALVAGPAIKMLGWLAGAASSVTSGFYLLSAGASASMVAWKAGLSLTTALQVGFGATAVALGALTVMVGSAIAVWAQYNEQVVKTNEAGNQAVESTWGQFFDDQVKSGKNATEVMAEYVAAQQRVKQVLDDTNPVLRAFVMLNDQQGGGFKEASQAAYQAATSYEDYSSALIMAAEAADLEIDAEGRLIKWHREGHGVRREVIDANYLLTESEFEVAKATEAAIPAIQAFSSSAGDMGNTLWFAAQTASYVPPAIEEIANTSLSASSILSTFKETLTDLGYQADFVEFATSDLAIALGELDPQVARLQKDVELLAEAYGRGVITGEEFTQAMQAAQAGTLELSEAQRASIQASTDQARALQEAAAAAQEAAIRQMELAQRLKDATDAQIAQTAINELQRAYENGTLSFEDYITAVTEVQDTFGLADEKSRALAEGIGFLTTAITDGKLPADLYDDALQALIKDAQDGELNVDALSEAFFTSVKATEDAVTGMEEAEKAFESAATTAEISAEDIVEAFESKDWRQLGRDIGQGIAQGILEGAEAVKSAASQVAQETSDQVREDWQEKSPSQLFYKHAENAMAGLELGFLDHADQLTDTVSGLARELGQVDWALPPREMAWTTTQQPSRKTEDAIVTDGYQGWRSEAGNSPTHLTVNIDGRSVREVMLSRLSEELA